MQSSSLAFYHSMLPRGFLVEHSQSVGIMTMSTEAMYVQSEIASIRQSMKAIHGKKSNHYIKLVSPHSNVINLQSK